MPATPPDEQSRWVPALAEFLKKSQQAQAVLWEKPHQEISVATIGAVDVNHLRNLLQETINNALKTLAPQSHSAPPGFRLQKLPSQTLLEKEGLCTTSTTLWTWRRIPWPDPAKAAGVRSQDEGDWREMAWLATGCGVFGLIGLLLQISHLGPEWLPTLLYLISMIFGGWDAAKDSFSRLPRLELDIHFLMIAVAVGASLIGAHGEAALLLFLFSTSGALEHYALYKTRREINALFALAPRHAHIRDPKTGEPKDVPVDDVRQGDILIIRPGDSVPTDAEVLSGESATDESSLTGESTPVPKQPGDQLSSGTLNLWGSMEARCLRPASQSALQKIITLIREAQNSKAQSQRLTDRFGPAYSIAILSATAIMFFVWWLAFGIEPFRNTTDAEGVTTFSAFYRAMTLLVVASPCALVLSIPSAILAAIAFGARKGILFRGGAAIEKLSQIDTVAMDKTGTLTTGELHITAIESFPPGHEDTLIRVAYTLETRSTHPIARAIVQHGKRNRFTELELTDFISLTGHGVSAIVAGQKSLIGRRELLLTGPLAQWTQTIPPPPPDTSEVWLLHGEILGRILLQDTIRETSAAVLKKMHEMKLHTIMLTGDRRETAVNVARQLGIGEVLSGLSPENKLQIIRDMSAQGNKVAMIGDGVNDAPCLAAAYVSVAMGARGSDAALEQSEVVLMHDHIENFLTALHISRAARNIIFQNLTISLGTIIVMVVSSLGGFVPITLGVMAHEGSTLLVCLNSLRLLSVKTAHKTPTGQAR